MFKLSYNINHSLLDLPDVVRFQSYLRNSSTTKNLFSYIDTNHSQGLRFYILKSQADLNKPVTHCFVTVLPIGSRLSWKVNLIQNGKLFDSMSFLYVEDVEDCLTDQLPLLFA